jgi:hypothetical protein
MDSWIDLLTTYIHHSELQIITVPLLISIHRSRQHPLILFSACCVFNSRFLARASNVGDSSASCAHIVTLWRISHNWTLVNCQLNWSAISSQLSLQSSTQLPTLCWQLTSHSPTNYFTSLHFTSLHSTDLHSTGLGSSLYSLGGRPNRKHCLQQSIYCCYGQLPSNSSDIVDVFTGRYQATHVPSCDNCIAMVLHVTLLPP